uniref:Protein-lysine N-methyltransferase LOC113792515 n=1 Tax=Dermatophagoides pteronyssinus TaxID=6956 RepID=A0A6P6XYF2_DERPT|nr:EEF1A lysine methyltransferase 2-like [Dermatophagoides pteronyssinus]
MFKKMATKDNEEFITESELGTKQYWDQFYDEELTNFIDFGDSGETWFGTRNTRKIIDWVSENHAKNDAICDIGCGNGFVLAQLAQRNFSNLYGLDYSEKAIEFCQKQHNRSNIHFKVVNILDDSFQTDQKFDAIIDKGTYDAICLMPNTDIHENRKKYLKFLCDNLKNEGHFIIITCNFTKEEIFAFLSISNNVYNINNFHFTHEFDTPTLSFGGHIGKQITGLIFRKKIQ